MTTPKINRPRLRVVLEQTGTDELVQVDVQTDNRDAIRFDLLASRKGWPGADAAPLLWMTVQAWSALKRSKAEPWASMKVEDFMETACLDVEAIDEHGQPITDPEAMLARPTQPGAEPG